MFDVVSLNAEPVVGLVVPNDGNIDSVCPHVSLLPVFGSEIVLNALGFRLPEDV
jgi:hypothetical protein